VRKHKKELQEPPAKITLQRNAGSDAVLML
jgi:hypothetical protein